MPPRPLFPALDDLKPSQTLSATFRMCSSQALVALRRKYGFCLALDEAHATLVCGHSGGGAAEAAGVSGDEVNGDRC